VDSGGVLTGHSTPLAGKLGLETRSGGNHCRQPLDSFIDYRGAWVVLGSIVSVTRVPITALILANKVTEQAPDNQATSEGATITVAMVATIVSMVPIVPIMSEMVTATRNDAL